MKKNIVKAIYMILSLGALVCLIGDCTGSFTSFLLIKGCACLVLAISANRLCKLLPEEEV